MSDKKAAKRLAHSLQIQGIFLVSCEFETNKALEDKTGSLSLKVDVDGSFDEAHEVFTGAVKMAVSGRPEGSDERVFSIRTVHEARYKVTERSEWEKEEIDHFLESSLLMHVWPYLREFVYATTSKSPVTPCTLPTLPVRTKVKNEPKAG